MTVNDLAIWTENLTRSFAKVQAVDRLSLEIPAGVIFGFLGPNGAGKTTTIRLLMGLLDATSGQAKVLGFDVQKQAGEIRERTGALLEHSGLYERLSAEDNLEFFGRIWHLSATKRTARIKELLDHFGLWERRKESVGTWSRGMRQKLSIARALLHRPSLIFLDEPTAGLDPVMAAAVRDDLAALVKHEGVTVFLTTHNLTEAEKLCSLIAVVRQGKLLAIGHPDELRAQGGELRVEIVGRGFRDDLLAMLQNRPEIASVDLQNNRLILELREETNVAPLTRLLVTAGVEIEEIHKEKASLEEVFLILMKEQV
jgi:ABC-2 type transport system ATP-binding protein